MRLRGVEEHRFLIGGQRGTGFAAEAWRKRGITQWELFFREDFLGVKIDEWHFGCGDQDVVAVEGFE